MIDVLLATCRPNDSWLKEQIRTIRSQCDVDVNLLVREDVGREGPCANFARLLDSSNAEYVAFSDQDDVWLPGKLKTLMGRMRELEEAWGGDVPLLVFSDATVVDSELKVLSPSLFRRIRVDPKRTLPRQLVFQNVPYGNVMLFNAALRDLANPIPPEAVMHDHWVALVASAFGHLAFVDKPLVSYRLHDGNVNGGKCVGPGYFLGLLRGGCDRLRRHLYAEVGQVESFCSRFGDRTPPELRALPGLAGRSKIARVAILIRHRIFKNGLIRNLGTWMIV